MASLLKDPSGNWHVHFRFAGSRFKRSLRTKSDSQARAIAGRIEDNIRLAERGVRGIPPDADVFRFLLSDGSVHKPVRVPKSLSLQTLFDDYKQSVKGSIEPSSFSTIGLHTAHFLRILGSRYDPRKLSQECLQKYISTRQAEMTNRGTTVTPTTVRKEVATISAIWSWAPDTYELRPFPTKKKLRYGKTAEKPPFQTWAQIETVIARGGLTAAQKVELWDCVFLSLDEISDLLDHVREKAIQPFVYPMVVTAAHTGARRSELVRARIADIQEDAWIIREAKRVKGKRSTRRVPLSSLLSEVLGEWLQIHPGGQYIFCTNRMGSPQPLTKHQAHDHFKRTLSQSKWRVLRGWHVLRHSFISNCALKGIDQRIIDSFVGHSTDEMRRRYTHLFPSAQKYAIDSVFR